MKSDLCSTPCRIPPSLKFRMDTVEPLPAGRQGSGSHGRGYKNRSDEPSVFSMYPLVDEFRTAILNTEFLYPIPDFTKAIPQFVFF